MYRMLYNDSFLFDPFDETRIVSSASITTNVNAASYLDFTIAATHPLYNTIEQRSGTITLYSNNEKLFQGQITSIEMDMDGNKAVTCSSALDWLKDVQLRPYSTDQTECDEYEFKLDKAPDALDAYFQWLIDQYNAQNKDDRYFTINVNQAADLTDHNIVYFASTSPRSVADAIEEDILNTFGGYLVLRYEDDQLILDLYSDIHEMNEQIIDYGENILDISRVESTDDQYTAVYPIGATPQYTAEQQKYHDEKDAYDERMKEREETEKAAIDKLKQEEEAEQKRIDGMAKGQAKTNAQNALKQRKEQRQAREQAFSAETKKLQDEQKVKDDKNAEDKTKPNPITIESLNNGGYEGDLDIFKEADVIYSVSYVQRYGYKEFVYSENDIDDKNELLKSAVAKLKTLMAPMLTIEVRAVDQALYNPKHTHLFAGQAVRVRSKPHNIDEFMMVSAIELDLIDPSQTTATLGVAYDTLTGQQSSFMQNLNSQINASVDAVDKLGEDIKVTEINLGKVENLANENASNTELVINTVADYKWMTDTAWGRAEDAQEDANKANQGVTDTNIRIDNLKLATDERIDGMETDISGIRTEIANTKEEVEAAKQTAEQIRQEAQAGIDEAKQKAEDVRTEANTAIDTVKSDLAETEKKVQQAASNASAALGGLSSTNANLNSLTIKVNQNTEQITNVNGEIIGVKDTISGVAETANSALTVASQNTKSIEENSSRIDTAYSDIESTRTSINEVKQTADALKVNLETNYLDKSETAKTYASKAELEATSESITTTVSKNYATIATVDALKNIADAAIETWSGQGIPTASNPPASTWTTDELKKQHSGDIYYNMDDGKSYRWGSTDGVVYSWTLIADSDITKAIADAAKAQETADGAKQDVVNLTNQVQATYATKAELKQTSDAITATVTEVASTANANTEKIGQLQVKSDEISAKVSENASTIDEHTTTIGQLSMKADGLQTKFEQVSSDVSQALANSEELVFNGGFELGTDGWNTNPMIDDFRELSREYSHSGEYRARFMGLAKEIISTKPIPVTTGQRYRMGIWYRLIWVPSGTNGGIRFQQSSDGVNFKDWVNVNLNDWRTAEWIYLSAEGVPDINIKYVRARIAFNQILDLALDDISIRDITDVHNVDVTATTALTRASELQQSLDGFKTTVSETYLKKDDAASTYSTKSELNQTANEIKATVSEQAATIDEHTTTIGQLSLKADKFETDISQTSQQVNGVLDRTSKLEQNLDGFKTTVSNTYISKTDADKNLTDAINDIQIGGTNMLLDTQKFGNANPNGVTDVGTLSTLEWASSSGTYNQFTYRHLPETVTANNPNGPQYSNIPVKSGGTYTASFYYRGTADMFVYFYGPSNYLKCLTGVASNGQTYIVGNQNGDGNITISASSEWKRYWITWTLEDNASKPALKHLLFRRKGTTGYIDIAGVKLEEGNKATEWSPSPFDTLYASTITSTYATNSKVEQTEQRITSTVEATYATKTALSDEMKKSVKTVEIREHQDGNYWQKLGRLTMEQQGRDFHIDYTGGRGYNGLTSQNSQLEIHVRSSNGLGNLFAVTVNRLLNADMYVIKAFAIDSTHVDLYMHNGLQFSTGTMAYYGQYTDFSGAQLIDDITTVEGTELTVYEQTLTTKSYVDQTAESVSIGVVEDYKSGVHGDKLTTQSDITALKDSITLSVNQQYADLANQIELKGSENVVQNPSFELDAMDAFEGWVKHDNWTYASTNPHTGVRYAQTIIKPGANGDELVNSGAINVEYGHVYRCTFWVKSNLASGVDVYLRYQAMTSQTWNSTNYGINPANDYISVDRSWKKIEFYISPRSDMQAIRARIIGRNTSDTDGVLAVDDVSLIDYSVANTINQNVSEIQVKTDSITQTVAENYATLEGKIGEVGKQITGLKNPNFDQVDNSSRLTGWSANGSWTRAELSAYSPVQSGSGSYFVGAATAGQAVSLVNDGYISTYPGMKLKISVWVWADDNVLQNNQLSIGIIQQNDTVTRNLVSITTNAWRQYSAEIDIPDNVDSVRVRIAYTCVGNSAIRLDSVAIADVTNASVALGKATEAVQDLNGFKNTVKNTYATQSTVETMQSQWTQTAEGFTADIQSISSSVTIVNGDFEHGLDGWYKLDIGNSVVESNISLIGGLMQNVIGNTTHALYVVSAGNCRISNSGRVISGDNNILVISGRFCVIDSSGNGVSGFTCTPGVFNRHTGVPYNGERQTSTTGWQAFRVSIPVNSGSYSAEFAIGNLNGNRMVFDDITLENNTEGASARKDIDALNTRIAMTANGVRVGKIENGNFVGTSALMNSEGSFDILQGEETVNTFATDGVKLLRNADTNAYEFNILPFDYDTGGSVNFAYHGVNLQSLGIFSLNGVPATPAVDSIVIKDTNNSVNYNTELQWDTEALNDSQMVKNFNGRYLHEQYYTNINKGMVPCPPDAVDHCICVTDASDSSTELLTTKSPYFMILHPAWYMLQMQSNLYKETNVTYVDILPEILAVGSTTWVVPSTMYAYRAVEQGDATGWHTRPSPMFVCKLDVGTRLRWKVRPNANTTRVGGMNRFTITRLPFSGLATFGVYNYS